MLALEMSFEEAVLLAENFPESGGDLLTEVVGRSFFTELKALVKRLFHSETPEEDFREIAKEADIDIDSQIERKRSVRKYFEDAKEELTRRLNGRDIPHQIWAGVQKAGHAMMGWLRSLWSTIKMRSEGNLKMGFTGFLVVVVSYLIFTQGPTGWNLFALIQVYFFYTLFIVEKVEKQIPDKGGEA